jgi:hypothetical protein
MRPKTKPTSEKLLLTAVTQLAEMVSLDETAINQSDYEQGVEVIEIQENAFIHANFKRWKETKIQVFHQIIQDLSTGGEKLSQRLYGIELKKDKLTEFSCSYGEPLPKHVIFSVGLQIPYQNLPEYDQEELNMAIYALVVRWGVFLRELSQKKNAA